jgi:hypothetical protein
MGIYIEEGRSGFVKQGATRLIGSITQLDARIYIIFLPETERMVSHNGSNPETTSDYLVERRVE